MSTLLLLTSTTQPSAEVLPALALLPHQVRILAAEGSALLEAPEVDLVLVDGRKELAHARDPRQREPVKALEARAPQLLERPRIPSRHPAREPAIGGRKQFHRYLGRASRRFPSRISLIRDSSSLDRAQARSRPLRRSAPKLEILPEALTQPGAQSPASWRRRDRCYGSAQLVMRCSRLWAVT